VKYASLCQVILTLGDGEFINSFLYFLEKETQEDVISFYFAFIIKRQQGLHPDFWAGYMNPFLP